MRLYHDNGFSDEIIPLHIFEERGALITSLRATEGGMPQRTSHRKIYEDAGEGEADYQIYDREITDAALSWLREHSTKQDRPWVLLISYPSPHPPFRVPEKYWDLYPLDEVSMPVQWQPNKRRTALYKRMQQDAATLLITLRDALIEGRITASG